MDRWTGIRVRWSTRDLIRRIAAIQERDMETVVKLMALAELERYAIAGRTATEGDARAVHGLSTSDGTTGGQ